MFAADETVSVPAGEGAQLVQDQLAVVLLLGQQAEMIQDQPPPLFQGRFEIKRSR